jgi:dienelactone hydrolase
LRLQPEVDPQNVLVLGASRGSEAALLLGAHYPSLVHGVIASVPSNSAICSFPSCTGPAWTLDGKPLPYTKQFDDPAPTDDPAAVIPVERIRGPIFLDCGALDQVWTSCAYAQAVVKRLAAHGFAFPRVLYRAQMGDHYFGSLVPYEPGPIALSPGTGTVADEHAREWIWPKLLAFLARV